MNRPESALRNAGWVRAIGRDLGQRLRFRDLFSRAVIDVILGCALLAALSGGGLWLLIVLVVLMLAAETELYGALRRGGHRPATAIGLLGGVGMIAGTAVTGLVAVPVDLLVVAAAAACCTRFLPQWEGGWKDFGWTILGVIWVAGGLSFGWPIARAHDGPQLVLATFLILATLDSGQLILGRAVGRRPLAPRLSPNKTIEGLLGGAGLAMAVALLVAALEPFNVGSALALAAVIIVVGPIGDLAVSLLKRSLGIKDLGTLARGHGGVMDLLDSALLVLPAVWLLFRWLGFLH